MITYALFGFGVVFILFGFFYSKPRENNDIFSSGKETLSDMERVSKQMIVQLEQTAEHILQQIDHKSSQLEKLIVEADNFLKTLEKNKKYYSQSLKISRKLSPLEEKQQKILGLLEQGKELVEVAKIMKMGKGEIQLVLDLGKTGWNKVEND